MTTTDLIIKSIENLILYGIELGISDEDSSEFLFQMENYFNENSEDLIATLDIDHVIVDTIKGDNVCHFFIQEGILRIIPATTEYTFNTIIIMLEFITSCDDLFDKKETEEIEEESDDDFDWI